jgi:hypothetical protein
MIRILAVVALAVAALGLSSCANKQSSYEATTTGSTSTVGYSK